MRLSDGLHWTALGWAGLGLTTGVEQAEHTAFSLIISNVRGGTAKEAGRVGGTFRVARKSTGMAEGVGGLQDSGNK